MLRMASAGWLVLNEDEAGQCENLALLIPGTLESFLNEQDIRAVNELSSFLIHRFLVHCHCACVNICYGG